MHGSCWPLLRGVAIGVVLLASSAAARAADVRVQGWSASWSFGDDFADGSFPDGDPGEFDLYDAPCGGVDDAAESDGRLRLAGPGAACNGTVAATPRVLLAATFVVRARFELVDAPPNASIGIVASTPGFGDERDLLIERGSLLGPGSDAIGVALVVNGLDVERALLSTAATAYLATHATFELELLTSDGADFGLPSVPHARYRACPLEGCSAAVPFVDLPDVASPGTGAISGHQPWLLSFIADGSSPFSVDLLEWHLEMHSLDSFSGGFENRLDYEPQCASLLVENAALIATPTDMASCDGSLAVPLAQAPGEASVQGTFAWSVPEPCTAGFGVGLASDKGASPSRQGAFLYLMRGPLAGVGEDVIFAVLEGETSDAERRPWLELLPLWGDPDVPPPIDSIEFRIETLLDPVSGSRIPHGQLRTCPGSDCGLVYAPYLDLLPYAFPQDDPSLPFCGAIASELARSDDGGAIDPNAPLLPLLLFAPEPAAALAAMSAVAALAALQRRQARLAHIRARI